MWGIFIINRCEGKVSLKNHQEVAINQLISSSLVSAAPKIQKTNTVVLCFPGLSQTSRQQVVGVKGRWSCDHEAGSGGSGVKPSLWTRRTRSVGGGKCTSLLVLVPLPVSALINALVSARCRPASDPDGCDRRGETFGERGHRRGRDPPQSAERRLAAVAAQGQETLFSLSWFFAVVDKVSLINLTQIKSFCHLGLI